MKLHLCANQRIKLFIQEKKSVFKYTTVSGITGFDGSRKEAPKAVVKSIND